MSETGDSPNRNVWDELFAGNEVDIPANRAREIYEELERHQANVAQRLKDLEQDVRALSRRHRSLKRGAQDLYAVCFMLLFGVIAYAFARAEGFWEAAAAGCLGLLCLVWARDVAKGIDEA